MCLDVNYIHNNQNNMKESSGSRRNSDEKNVSKYDLPVKCLCGGSLIEHQPVFDPNGE